MMKGSILDFSVQTSEGIISGDDNQRYKFNGSSWRAQQTPVRGMRVDFEAHELVATEIFLDAASSNSISLSGNKLAPGICGILVGALGVHKFILGYTTAGIIMLLVTVLTLGLGGIFMGLIGFIEGILYLTKSDEEFNRIYVVEKRPWF